MAMPAIVPVDRLLLSDVVVSVLVVSAVTVHDQPDTDAPVVTAASVAAIFKSEHTPAVGAQPLWVMP
jgi:hypothetical protein